MLYQYQCNKCGKHFEEFRKVDDRDNAQHCKEKADRLVSGGQGIMVDYNLKDSKGTPIWFPKDGGTYYDKALQRTFHTKKEKHGYMKSKGYIQDGSMDRNSQREMSRRIK